MKNRIVKDIINTFVSIAKGLKVTLVNWSILRPPVTMQYPEEMPELPERYRGCPTLPIDPETGKNACIACGACAKMCPQSIITVELDTTDPKDRIPAVFKIDMSQCMWCGLCSEVCPKNCLVPGRDFELACYTKDEMLYDLLDNKDKVNQKPLSPPEKEPAELSAEGIEEK